MFAPGGPGILAKLPNLYALWNPCRIPASLHALQFALFFALWFFLMLDWDIAL